MANRPAKPNIAPIANASHPRAACSCCISEFEDLISVMPVFGKEAASTRKLTVLELSELLDPQVILAVLVWVWFVLTELLTFATIVIVADALALRVPTLTVTVRVLALVVGVPCVVLALVISSVLGNESVTVTLVS